MTLPVLIHPDPFLREKSQNVNPQELASKEWQEFFDAMTKTMQEEDGIGLAAPQVGRHDRVIVVTLEEKPHVFVNPVITKHSWRKRKSEEGCLSVPGITGVVERYRSVSVQAFDRHGKPIHLHARGLEAVIFQHEIDHLDGILFIDRMDKIS